MSERDERPALPQYTKVVSGARVRLEARLRDVMYTRSQSNDRDAPVVVEAASADVYTDAQRPIDMILHCRNCGMQHIDEPSEEALKLKENGIEITHVDEFGPVWTDGVRRSAPWNNPPHRSHLCHGCGYIWRPADVATNGVAAIKTRGKNDSPEPNYETQNEAQGYALEAIHQFVPELRFREDGRTLLTPAQVETVLRRMGWKPPGEKPVADPAALRRDFSGGNDLHAMCEAFHRLIEAHAHTHSPFHNPVVSDAQMALRVLRGVVSAIGAARAEAPKPADTHVTEHHVKALKQQMRADPQYALRFLVEAGIANPDGTLTEHYRAEAKERSA